MRHFGSTTEELSVRMARHRGKIQLLFEGHVSIHSGIFNEFGLENCKNELLDTYPCKSRAELEARESHYVCQKQSVNRTHIGRTSEEYYWEHVEENKLKTKYGERTTKNTKKSKIRNTETNTRRTLHKQIKEKRLCECGRWVSLRNMASHKKTTKHQELTTNLPK